MATKVRKRLDPVSYKQGETKVKLRIDKSFLGTFIIYLFTNSKAITRASLQIAKKVFDSIDESFYMADVEHYTLFEFVKMILMYKVDRGIDRKSIIIEEARQVLNTQLIDSIMEKVNSEKSLSLQEIKEINNQIVDRFKYLYFVYNKDNLKEMILRYETGDYDSNDIAADDFEVRLSTMLNDIRKAKGSAATEVFNLSDEVCIPYITALVKMVNDPARCYKTGIKYLNDMLSPGFAPGRIYLFMGITGGYKSSILLQCARWIKMYNKPILKRKDPLTTTPTILLITTENSVHETVQRLFNMYISDIPMSEYTPESAIKELRNHGKFFLKDLTDTDIVIKYYANNELETNDLYGIIEDLEDDNREVIALIFDYIKRIRPSEPASDERLQMKNVSNELKSLAVKLDIPVITANQINRQGNLTIDAAAGEGKEDLGRMLGRGNIAVSWDILENVDWAAIINLEREKKSDIMHLTIKRVKIRYKDLARYAYINHPFEKGSTLRLVDDINMDSPISKESLASDMEGVSNYGSKGTTSVGDREIISSKRKDVELTDFNFNSALYGSD